MNKSFFYRIDWIVLFCYLSLVFFGLVNIYSSSNYNEINDLDLIQNITNELINKESLAGKHFIVFSFSIIMGFFILFIRTQFFQQLSYLVYFASILSLIGLFIFGQTINSANSWYVIKGISIQPSELAKIGTILALARHLSDFNTDITKFQSFFKGVVLILIPSILIILQPDPGSAIIFGSFFL